jgi:predicted Zn finger-like uncharacterized protein
MIVKCDKCQTRFKIPDEKVTGRGVKVRCTRCQNSFRVSKGAELPPADPFEQFALPRVETRPPPPPAAPPSPPPSFEGWNGAAAGSGASGNGGTGGAMSWGNSATVEESSGLLGEVPEFGELFRDSGEASPPSRNGAYLPFSEADRALFDMPPPAEPPPAPSPPEWTAHAADPPAPAQAPETHAPRGDEKEPAAAVPGRPSVLRGAIGLVANVLVASALLLVLLSVGTIYLNEGRIDLSAVSLDAVKALFTRPGDLLAQEISNGLYETRGHRDVFYVRGEVENRGSSPRRAHVTVEILDGSAPLTRGDVLAGVEPTAEQLYEVSSAADLSALNARLAAAAVDVKPGARVPFLVAFHEYPPELSQYRLRVTVRDAREATR